jgi:Calcineurin-like phosphoesterase/Purple acid Phosphatase, N-terminal domain
MIPIEPSRTRIRVARSCVNVATSKYLLAGLLLGAGWARGTVLHGPLLQGGTSSNVYVLAECSLGATSPMTIQYGTTSAYGLSATTALAITTSLPSYVHIIKLTGLQPNTQYHYQLSGQGTTSPDYAFRTVATPGTAFRFAWACDFRNGTAVHGQIARAILNSNNVPNPPLFCLSAGDYASDNTYLNWTNQWFVPDELTLESSMVSYLAPGNHDGWSSAVQMKAFDKPPDSSGVNGYYSFDCGDLHVTVANYQTTYASGAQYTWIQQDVQASLKPWKIFAAHAPAYTYGGSGSHGGDAGFQTISANLLVPNGVKVFLAGHNHFYQRNLVSGLHHVTCGAAGAPLYAVSSASSTIVSASDNCYLIADVTPTNLHLVAYNNAGAVLDNFTLVKLPAPANLLATPGLGQVPLTWDAVPGATSYTAYYGTMDGGPYPSKKTSALPATTVTGLTSGTRYYFVVSATDTNGPSAISAQASATPTNPPPVAPLISSFGTLSNGGFSLGGTCSVGQSCVLLVASNVAPPIVWTPIATNTANANGAFSVTDPLATNYPQRFYRIGTP